MTTTVASVALLTAGFVLTLFGLVGAWLSARRALGRQHYVAASSRDVQSFFEEGHKQILLATEGKHGSEVYNALRAIETGVRNATRLPDTTAAAFDPTGEGAKVAALRFAFESITWDLIWLGSGIVLTFIGSLMAFSA